MAKLNRNALKEIVKECLVEILAEGLSEGKTQSLQENFNKFSRPNKPTRPKTVQRKKENSSFKENTKKAISSVTSDPVMASIFADTAQNTLQEQISAEGRSPVAPGDKAAQVVSQKDPGELFGESAGNWAALAFSD
tara:strand:+ start:182 stop:589 length:408 start_codon:yes stop_codon:yes gene_type:complete